ncbi:MAG: DNA repair protein RecO [Betaproteobacteria bacterium]|nr:DNA repair protein RecO [Betaproteobacteria bacterium]
MSDLAATGLTNALAKTPVQGVADRGFVLHTYPYRETSLIVESFTATHGRVVFVAKGAKRPNGALRGALHPFQPLTLRWFGKAEMKTLKTAEQVRILPQLSGSALLSAFYLNELTLKLTQREDPHEGMFEAYAEAMEALSGLEHASSDVPAIAAILRRFEATLLQELGYALQLGEEADSHVPLVAEREYSYMLERGPVPYSRVAGEPINGDNLQLRGKTLLDMSRGDYADPITQQQAKQLMRKMINHLLGDKTLHTRTLIRELR